MIEVASAFPGLSAVEARRKISGEPKLYSEVHSIRTPEADLEVFRTIRIEEHEPRQAGNLIHDGVERVNSRRLACIDLHWCTEWTSRTWRSTRTQDTGRGLLANETANNLDHACRRRNLRTTRRYTRMGQSLDDVRGRVLSNEPDSSGRALDREERVPGCELL